MDITIDCGTCSRQKTSTCDGCVVTFLAQRQPDEAVVLAMDDYSALRRLESAGLVPRLQHDQWVAPTSGEQNSEQPAGLPWSGVV